MLYGSDTWCLGQKYFDFSKNWKSHGEKYAWSEINGQEVDKHLMQMLDLEETIDQLAKAHSIG